MEKQFPSTDHMITHFGMWGGGDNIWNTESHFGGRYTLTMQVPITIDYANDTFVISGPLNVWLFDALTCTRNGRTSYKLDGSGQRQFGEADIQKLIAHNWDWGVVGVSINPQPVQYFEISEAMTRAPRYPISLTAP